MSENKLVYVGNQLVNIGSTSYDIQERMIEISKKFYNIDEINLLKTGFFGYTNEIMSDIAKNGVWHRNFLYNELFLNTANLTSSVYNWAKMLDENIQLASPARMNILFTVGKQEIIDLSRPTGPNPNIREFIIDKESLFFAEDYKFMLENSVRIILTKVEGFNDYSATAQYILNENSNKLQKLTSPYVKSYIENINGKKYIVLMLMIHQISKEEKIFNIYSNDISDLLYFDYKYQNQLAFFNVKYKYGNESQILPSYFNNSFIPPDSKYCFYTFPNENNIQIYFSALPGSFIPKYNSELTIELYNTLGSKGNFNYNVEVPLTFKFPNPNMRISSVLVTSIADSYGGMDVLGLDELKSKLINKLHTRNSIISERDLNLFFTEIIQKSNVYGSQLNFFKTRDDILRRSFSAYMLLKDKYSQIVPTNTVDFLGGNINEFMDDRESVTLHSGEIVKYDALTLHYKRINENDDVNELIENGEYLYSLPFTINVKTMPFPRISYILDICNMEVPLSFEYINPKVNNEFLIPQISVKKLDFLSSFYDIEIFMGTNMDEEYLSENIKIRCILMRNDTTPYAYFDFNLDETSEGNVYKFSLKTSREFNKFDEIELVSENGNTNYLKRLNLSGVAGINIGFDEVLLSRGINPYEIIPNCNVQENLTFKLAILIKDPEVNGVKNYNDTGNNSSFLQMFKNQEDTSDYSIVSVLKTDRPINLFKNLSNIMYSEVFVNPSTLNFTINKIPVVFTKYFNNEINYSNFYELFNTYVTVLKENLNLLEQNTKVDMRFYNSYGICKYSSIDRVNIELELNLKLNSNQYSTELDANIKNSIIEMIEQFNLKNQGLITISSIYSELIRKFPQISFIEFIGLNDYTAYSNNINKVPHLKQRIELIVPTPLTHDYANIDKEHLINFVPEFINIPRNKDFEINQNTNALVFQPSIKINYLQDVI